MNPYGHVAFQARRGDVHTVLVDGRIVKYEDRWSGPTSARCGDREATVDYLRSALGEEPGWPG